MEKKVDHIKKNQISQTIGQFIAFAFIGVSGIGVDTMVIVLLREIWGVDIRLAAFPAFFVAATWNYELNRRMTFRTEVKEKDIPRRKSYIAFLLVCALGLFLRLVVMHVLIEYIKMDDHSFLFGILRYSYISNFIGILVGSIWNFCGSKYLAFGQRH